MCVVLLQNEQYIIMVSEPVAFPCVDAAGTPCSLHSAASCCEGKQLHLIKLQHLIFKCLRRVLSVRYNFVFEVHIHTKHTVDYGLQLGLKYFNRIKLLSNIFLREYQQRFARLHQLYRIIHVTPSIKYQCILHKCLIRKMRIK